MVSADAFPDGDRTLVALARELGEIALGRRVRVITAESCTGGGIAAAITAVAGSSEWFDRGYVTYSNEAKIDMLEVHPETLAKFGAVSEEAAREMAAGALRGGLGDVSIAVTGVAGPTGGSPAKPVGTVFFGWCLRGGEAGSDRRRFSGDRSEVRRQSIAWALARLIRILSDGA